MKNWQYITIAWTARDTLIDFRRVDTQREAEDASVEMLDAFDKCARITICKVLHDTTFGEIVYPKDYGQANYPPSLEYDLDNKLRKEQDERTE
jgi:hypothetical protein